MQIISSVFAETLPRKHILSQIQIKKIVIKYSFKYVVS